MKTSMGSQKTTATPSKRFLIILGIFALLVGFPAVTSFAATGASISLSYTQKTTGNVNYIVVQIEAQDSQFPNTVNVTLSSYYNGASVAYNAQSVVVSPGPRGGVVYDFIVGYKGEGNYLFVAGIYNAKGTMLFGASIDPLIEPEWR
jgi:hypothetical protein